jgi:hypothetical protein
VCQLSGGEEATQRHVLLLGWDEQASRSTPTRLPLRTVAVAQRVVSSGVVRTILAWPRTSLRVTVSRGCCCRRACASVAARGAACLVCDRCRGGDGSVGVLRGYREDGHGRAAHDPAMMVALLLYAYATGRRTSRVIERACVDDVAFRVIAANQRPDHCTIARFRRRHEAALAGLFSDVLELCADAGLVGVAVLAVMAPRCTRTRRSTRISTTTRSLARSWPRPTWSTVPRTSASATGAATSCRPNWPRRRGGAAGCARPSADSRSGPPPKRSRSRRRVPSGCGRESAAWRRTTRCTAGQTRPTRPIARAG